MRFIFVLIDEKKKATACFLVESHSASHLIITYWLLFIWWNQWSDRLIYHFTWAHIVFGNSFIRVYRWHNDDWTISKCSCMWLLLPIMMYFFFWPFWWWHYPFRQNRNCPFLPSFCWCYCYYHNKKIRINNGIITGSSNKVKQNESLASENDRVSLIRMMATKKNSKRKKKNNNNNNTLAYGCLARTKRSCQIGFNSIPFFMCSLVPRSVLCTSIFLLMHLSPASVRCVLCCCYGSSCWCCQLTISCPIEIA